MEKITLRLAEDSVHGKAGQVVTLALTPADVHDPTELATYLAGYSPPEFRADEASPVILVDKEQDKFRTFAKDDAFRRVDVKAGGQGPVPEVDPSSSLSTFNVVYRTAGSFIPKQTEMQANANYQARFRASRRCSRALLLDREIDAWTPLVTSGSWTAGNVVTLGAGFQWGGLTAAAAGVNSDPIFDIQNMIINSAQYIDSIWFNQKTAFAFLRHANVRNHMRQALGDGAVENAVMQVKEAARPGAKVDFSLPGFPPFRVVASKVKNESTGALDFIVPDGAVVGVTRPAGVPGDGEEIATSYTFRFKGPSGVGFETREYFVDGRGPYGGTMVVATMGDIFKMTGTDCGGLILAALQ